MKKTVKTEEIVKAFKMLESAKFQNLEGGDIIKVWKITRLMKPTVSQFSDDQKDITEKLVPSEIVENLPKAQQYEKLKSEEKENLPMTEQEYQDFIVEYIKCTNLVRQALEEFLNKEVELDFEPITEDILGKMIAENNWTLSQVEAIEWLTA